MIDVNMKLKGSERWIGLSLPAVPRVGEVIQYDSRMAQVELVKYNDRLKSVEVYADLLNPKVLKEAIG